MRVLPLTLGLASVLSGLAIPAFVALWIFASAYRRARLDTLLADPTLLAGIGWPIASAGVLFLALTVGGGVLIVRSLRRA